MAFMDLRFGWKEQRFILRDVKLVKEVRLQEKDASGRWMWGDGDSKELPPASTEGENKSVKERVASLLAAVDKSVERHYEKPSRLLTAKAYAPEEFYASIFLGVPADKKSIRDHDKTLPFLELLISDRPSGYFEDALASRSFGIVGYLEPYEGREGRAYAEFDGIPADVMDQIQLAVGGQDLGLEVSLGIKCWNWLGPIGDTQIYISDSRDLQLAQLVGVKAYTISGNQVPDMLGKKAEAEVDYKAELVEIKQKLAGIESLGRSIRTFVAIVAGAAVVIVAIALFW